MRPPESFVGQPVRSLQTMLRVLSQEDNRLPNIIPDGIYGPSTVQSVSAFQRINGIPVTGVTDQRTWEEIVKQYDDSILRVGKATSIEILLEPGEILKMGDASPYLYLAQSMLIQLSQDHTVIPTPDHTGVLDEKTERSIFAFQQLSGLRQTGELDRVTWHHLVLHFTGNAHHNAAVFR